MVVINGYVQNSLLIHIQAHQRFVQIVILSGRVFAQLFQYFAHQAKLLLFVLAQQMQIEVVVIGDYEFVGSDFVQKAKAQLVESVLACQLKRIHVRLVFKLKKK
jgi:hypothetical protein